jgi:hypothetical protein
VTEAEREILKNHLISNLPQNPLHAFSEFLSKVKYDIVIDGANVALFNNEKAFNMTKLELMCGYFIRRQTSILLVLSEVRKNSKTKRLANSSPFIHVFWVPKQYNDDLYWLYAALINENAKFVTADKLRDHIFYTFNQDLMVRHIFDKWKDAHHIQYSFKCIRHNNKNFRLHIQRIEPRSKRVQILDDVVHVPTSTPQAGVGDDDSVTWSCIKII